MLFADMKLQAHERGLANVRDLDSKNAMIGLRDPRLAITCINFTLIPKFLDSNLEDKRFCTE
jgi:hypothetical protein